MYVVVWLRPSGRSLREVRFISPTRQRRQPLRTALVVSEEDGVRYLHQGGDYIQSAMRIDAPFDLELDYTRTMLAFLLFVPRPRDVLFLGLGGGSLPKFLFKRIPRVRLRVLELDPAVITAARALFHLPKNSARLQVDCGDGVSAVYAASDAYDVLVLDAFDDGAQVSACVTEDFYRAAAQALKSGGVLVANYFGHDRRYPTYLKRLARAFDGRVLSLDAREDGNVIALAFRNGPDHVAWQSLREVAAGLSARLDIDFDQMVSGLRRRNRYTRRDLCIVQGGEA